MGPGNRWDFDEKNMKNWAEHIGKKDHNSKIDGKTPRAEF